MRPGLRYGLLLPDTNRPARVEAGHLSTNGNGDHAITQSMSLRLIAALTMAIFLFLFLFFSFFGEGKEHVIVGRTTPSA